MDVIEAVSQIFFDSRVPSTALRLYGMLRSNPTLAKPQLAKITNRSKRSIDDNIDILEELGYIVIIETRARGRVEVAYKFPHDVPQMPLQKAS